MRFFQDTRLSSFEGGTRGQEIGGAEIAEIKEGTGEEPSGGANDAGA